MNLNQIIYSVHQPKRKPQDHAINDVASFSVDGKSTSIGKTLQNFAKKRDRCLFSLWQSFASVQGGRHSASLSFCCAVTFGLIRLKTRSNSPA